MEDRLSVARAPIYGKGGKISYTGTAANSPSLPKGTTGCFVTCTTDAWARLSNVVGSTAPVAVAGTTSIGGDMFCPAGVTVFLPNVNKTDEPLQLSVVQDAANGTANYTPAY